MPSKTDSSNKQRMNMDEHACNKNRSLRLPVLGDALRPSPQALVKRKGDGGVRLIGAICSFKCFNAKQRCQA